MHIRHLYARCSTAAHTKEQLSRALRNGALNVADIKAVAPELATTMLSRRHAEPSTVSPLVAWRVVARCAHGRARVRAHPTLPLCRRAPYIRSPFATNTRRSRVRVQMVSLRSPIIKQSIYCVPAASGIERRTNSRAQVLMCFVLVSVR